MAINKITSDQRDLMKQKSAQSLPDVPSSRGWTPKDFKNAITKPLFDNENSFFAHINRITEEIDGTKLNIADEKVFLFEEVFESEEAFATACLETQKINNILFGKVNVDSDVYRCVGILRNSRTIIGGKPITSKQVMVMTSKGDIYVTNGETKTKIIANQSYVNEVVNEVVDEVDTRLSAKIDKKAFDSEVVHNTGDETIDGKKKFLKQIELVTPRIVSYNHDNPNITYQEVELKEDGVYYANDYTRVRLADESDIQHAKNYTDSAISKIIDNAPQTLDTFKEVATYIASDQTFASQITANVNQNRERITALDNIKANRDELFSKDYDELINAPEKLNIVVRDTISADTYNEAREIQIGRDKFKFGSGSKIKANEFVDGTLPTLEYLNIDGNTYKLPNYVVDKSGLKLVAEGMLELDNDNDGYKKFYDFEEGKTYLISILDKVGNCVVTAQGTMKGNFFVTPLIHETHNDNFVFFTYYTGDSYICLYDMSYSRFTLQNEEVYQIYELPLGESAQVEKHNKTINALMQRVSDLEQKAGLTSVGYVQDSTLNLIRVNVVDDVLEVSGFKFDGEVMII